LTSEKFNELVKLGIFNTGSIVFPIQIEEDRTSKPMTSAEESKKGYLCPITRRLMRDPVKAEDGVIYERAAALDFINEFGLSPMYFTELKSTKFVPQEDLQLEIIGYVTKFPKRDPEYWEGKI
jgi:hypothetical protein